MTTTLSNGATVLRSAVRHDPGPGFVPNGVALCHRENSHHPYVVWTIYLHGNEWHAEHGDYFADLDTAVERYRERAGGAL